MTTKVQASVTPVAIAGAFEHDPSTTTASLFGFKAGAVNILGVRTAIAAGTVAVGGGVTYIYIDYSSTPVMASATSPPNRTTSIWLYRWNSVDDIDDLRSWMTSSVDPA